MPQKSEDNEKKGTEATHTNVTLKFNNKALGAMRALGRDFAVSAGLNALTFATGFTNIPDFSNSLAGTFAFAAIGTAAVGCGITVGRYLGGAIGMLSDKAGLTTQGQKTGSIIGATLSGAATHLTYHSGLWVMAFYHG